MKTLVSGIILAFVCLNAAGCKPSVSGETKKWETRTKAIGELKTAYPRFAAHLSAALMAAEKDWKAAAAESNADKKAQAMAKANEALDSKLIRQLNSVSSRNDGIDSDVKSLTKKRVPSSKVRQIERLISSARSKQRDAARLLATGDVATAEGAGQVADDAVGKLISASGDLSSAKKMAKGSKKK